MEEFCRQGGGAIDPDTTVGPGSWAAATLAAGAGLDAMERLGRGEADAAFCVVRPPGHHATPGRAMGFCILNNAAIVAAALAEQGERVLIVDWDAHHGNGTQEVFYADPRVLYVSMHEYPQYPGTGRADERGQDAGTGTTVNLPLPSGATGDVYLAAVDDVLLPAVDGFAPTWVVVSAGFDAHRADPLTDLGLTAGDFADLADRIFPLVPAGPPHRPARGRLRPRRPGRARRARAWPAWPAGATDRSRPPRAARGAAWSTPCAASGNPPNAEFVRQSRREPAPPPLP